MKKNLLIKLKIILSSILICLLFIPVTGLSQPCSPGTYFTACNIPFVGNIDSPLPQIICPTAQGQDSIAIFNSTVIGAADSIVFYWPFGNPLVQGFSGNFTGILKRPIPFNPDTCKGIIIITVCADFYQNCSGIMKKVGYGSYDFLYYPRPRPEFHVLPNDSLCINQQPFNFILDCDMTGYVTYSWNFGDTTTLADTANGVNPSYSYSQPGTYVVTCTATHLLCGSLTYSLTVVVGPLPTPIIIANPFTFCAGTQTTLDAGGVYAYYLWNTGATTQTINVSNPGNYTVIVTSLFGCTASTDTAVSIYPLPTPQIPGPASFCSGSSTTLYVNNIYPQYEWSDGTTADSLVVSSVGTYTVTVTDINNCTASTSINVTLSSNLNVILSAQPPSICNLNQTTVTANSGGGWIYAWSNGLTTQSFLTSAPATYTVTVTANGTCSGTASITIQSHPNPVDSISGNDTICTGQNTTFYLTGSYTAYQWSNGSTSPTINITQAGIYTVTITDANGCTATASGTLVVNTLPNAVISASPPSASACQGNTITLTASPPGMIYSWSNAATTASITEGANGNFTVTVTDPSSGCQNSASQQVTINPLPVPVITGTTSVCDGGPATLSTTISYSSYIWSQPGQTGPTFSTTIAGIYTVTVTDSNGCTGSASDTVNVSTNPGLSITVTDPVICLGDSTLVTATVSNCSSCIYQWSDGTSASATYALTQGYYTLTVTNSDGCSHDSSVFVTVNPSPVPNINGTTPLCQGTGTNLDAGVFSSYSWNTGATTQTIYVTTTNTYTITVIDANGCPGTDNITITVNPLPVPVITGNTTFCQGSFTILDAGLYSSWSWSSGATGQTINVNTAGVYTVTVTDVNGCTADTLATVIVNSLPAATISTTDTTLCQGEIAILDAGAGYNYSWSTGQTNQTITVSATGNYTVTVTDPNGCSDSVSQSVAVYPLPAAVINGPPNNAICQGQSAFLWANITNATYLWSTGETTAGIYVSNPGTYTLTITDQNGCSKTANFTLIVHLPPTVSIIGNTVFCAGGSTTLNAQTTGNIVSYLWTPFSNNSYITVTSGGTYSVTVTSNLGCTAVAGTLVTVNPAPAVNAITGPAAICFGQSGTLSVLPGYNYLWNTGKTTKSISVNTSGNYSVIVTNGFGCSVMLNHTVIVNPLPVPDITGTTPICQGASTILNAGPGYSNYAWSTNQTSQTINTGAAGLYTVTVTDVNGCTASDNIYLNVNPLPNPVIIGNSSICFGEQANMAVGSTYASYWWSNGANSQNTSTNLPGTYTVTVTDLNGCVGTASFTVTVVTAIVPVIIADGPADRCEGEIVTLTATHGDAYQWYPTGETTQSITVTQPGIYYVRVLNTCWRMSQTVFISFHKKPHADYEYTTHIDCGKGVRVFFENTSLYNDGAQYYWYFDGLYTSTQKNPDYLFKDRGVYPVTLIVVSPFQCIDTITKFIHIEYGDSAQARFTANPSPACVFNSNVNFTDHSKRAVSWSWEFGDGGKSTDQNPKHYYDGIGKYTVNLVVTNIDGCTSEYSETVLITPFYVPNAFTPNADGKNDVFFNSGYVLDVASYTMTIFNRWGAKVFENNNYNKFWNGFDKNNNLSPEGTYVYTIKVITKTNRKYTYEGRVSLIR